MPEPVAKQLIEQLAAGPLVAQDGRVFQLVLTASQRVRARAGWFQFALTIRDDKGQTGRSSLMTGIASGGGRGVMPWFEVRIYPRLESGDRTEFDARAAGFETQLIRRVGSLIPAGGHLMIEYESPGQSGTHRELLLRIPPAATHLGALMFAAGFQGHFKDWYISEGGHEGPRKLQANKSPNSVAAAEAFRVNLQELALFIKQPLPQNAQDAAIVARAQERARTLLKEFGSNPG
ncbi:MAG TPA: DUF1122 family protein [Candidatus Binataceae bacterium]|nr:DUF1122 family protein [Candidatus Binataceae bacterium]